MTTIHNKMDGNVRTLKAHPANDAATSELKQRLKDINVQYWRSSYLMEIYISVLEEEARQDEREPDLKAVGDRYEGMRREYKHVCITAQQCLVKHQNMSDIRNGLSINDTQQPRAQPGDNAAATPNAPGRLYKANG